MAVMINCPSCQRSIKAPDTVIGKQVKCPACQAAFTVTAGPVPPEPEPPLAQFDDEPEPAARRGPREPSAFGDFLAFRKMITPIIIQIIFWLFVGLQLLGGIAVMVTGAYFLRSSTGLGLLCMLGGLVGMILLPVLWRIYCEILILFFRMNETLTEIKHSIEAERRK
jgi:hypothetical protein